MPNIGCSCSIFDCLPQIAEGQERVEAANVVKRLTRYLSRDAVSCSKKSESTSRTEYTCMFLEPKVEGITLQSATVRLSRLSKLSPESFSTTDELMRARPDIPVKHSLLHDRTSDN